MSPKSSEILQDALQLPPTDRAELVEQILSSFEFSIKDEIDQVWAQKAEERIDAYEKGKIASISAKNVFEKIDRKMR